MDRSSDDKRAPRHVSTALVALTLVGGFVVGAVTLTFVAWAVLDIGPSPDVDGHESSGASADGHAADGYRVWSRNDDGSPVRWDPCSPIELVVATAGAPDGFLDDLAVAVELVREHSGLDLVVTGTTRERPAANRLPYQPERYGDRWAPVLVAWDTPATTAARLRDIDRAVATPLAVGTDGDRTYVTGQVVFNHDRADLLPGYDDRATSWGATILHELGHLVGLDHVDDPAELMAVHPGSGPVRLGPGDRAGLAAVGAGPCRTLPEPSPLPVRPPS